MTDAPVSRRAVQLRRRIERRYSIVRPILQLGPLELPFYRVADPDAVLDQVAAEADLRERLTGQRESDPQHLPYWAELWDSSIGMASYLAGRTNLGKHVSVLDLGCGMGLTGTVAAAKGCQVMFADMEADCLLFAKLNAEPFNRRVSTPQGGRTAVRARCLNWQRDNLGERFDLILGADILYERKQWDFLEPFWRQHLAPAGRILLGEPGRPTGDDFGQWITARGWTLTSREIPVTTRPKPIRLFSLQLSETLQEL